MDANDLKRRLGAELRKASRAIIDDELPTDMLDCLDAIRTSERAAQRRDAIMTHAETSGTILQFSKFTA